ncbi:Gfo/Idh/MocA family protein [Haloarcula salinisoli]|uniref:Gfo/Idh/MocA family oxidoreductase n=1 Tax=Haloarcula salinisoli TaxID=2487746 RepID=A0A8J8CBB7_9EURY|nr:Gfo/Idh/MocA family oxidoreductase [Halomicroarcula salinisoli]MBX0288591.1 Gfo/Idh/MocA family oxidoreductase [Halomicroarcula salinisoli]MBX0306029.1 Gfo/Idh/MocA family oxidoreductase [Halomicroarcula salinisoli]
MEVGVIGAGGIAKEHMRNLDALDDVSITAVCDIDEETANRAAGKRDAAAYVDHEELYDTHGDALDAVFICIPPFAHTTQETIAAERDIPFLVEKPVTVSVDKAKEIASTVSESDIMTHVSYESRFNPTTDLVEEYVGDRQISLMTAQFLSPIPPQDWFTDEAKSGGQLFEQTSHYIDLFRYFAGEVESVMGYGAQEVLEDELNFNDTTAVVLEHESGTISQVASTTASPDYDVSGITMVGDDFRLVRQDESLTGTVAGEEVNETATQDNHYIEDKAFVEAVRNDNPDRLRCPYADGVKTLEVVDAVKESIETGERVYL